MGRYMNRHVCDFCKRDLPPKACALECDVFNGYGGASLAEARQANAQLAQVPVGALSARAIEEEFIDEFREGHAGTVGSIAARQERRGAMLFACKNRRGFHERLRCPGQAIGETLLERHYGRHFRSHALSFCSAKIGRSDRI